MLSKLRHGAEKSLSTILDRLPRDSDELYEAIQQYGDARDQAGCLRGLETALLKVTGLSVDVERCKQLQLTTQAWEEALDSAANAIEQLKEQP